MAEQEQQIEVGQVWRRRKTGREVRITAYDGYWDDARYRWVEGNGGGPIAAWYLRRDYDLITPTPTPAAGTERGEGSE